MTHARMRARVRVGLRACTCMCVCVDRFERNDMAKNDGSGGEDREARDAKQQPWDVDRGAWERGLGGGVHLCNMASHVTHMPRPRRPRACLHSTEHARERWERGSEGKWG